MQVATAITQAADDVQAKVSECLAALSTLSAELQRHAETNAAVSVELEKQSGCKELAIERELLSRIQSELAQRATHVVNVRGRCSLPPLSQMLETFKQKAAAKLMGVERGHDHEADLHVHRRNMAAMAAPATQTALQLHRKPTEEDASLKRDVQMLAQGLQAVAAQVQHLMRQQLEPRDERHAPQHAPSPGLQILEVTPRGTALPQHMQPWRRSPVEGNEADREAGPEELGPQPCDDPAEEPGHVGTQKKAMR